jgi:alkyl hydroperoxide reductase subunit AhpC
MDQFAQLRDRVKEFEKRAIQVLFVQSEEAAYIRQWLRSRDKWDKEVPDFFEDSAAKHPWLRSRGTGAEETTCPILADPSGTTSADYGVALQGFPAATFFIDPAGVLRWEHRAKGSFNRPPVDAILTAIDDLGKPTASKVLEGVYLIESALKSGMVLDVPGAKTEDLTPIQLAGPGNQENRRWRLISVGKGECLIESALKKWVILDVRGAKAEKGTPVQLGGSGHYARDQGSNRRWKLFSTGENGEYRIESLLKEGLVLEVKDGKAENSTPIQVGEWENEARQRWRLIRVDLGN